MLLAIFTARPFTGAPEAIAPTTAERSTNSVPRRTAGLRPSLYTFCSQANCTDGAEPWAGLIFDHSGNLYGTTIEGGTGLLGTVFELSPPAQTGGAWTQQTPLSALIADKAGNLYGLAGGGAYNKGVVFGIAP